MKPITNTTTNSQNAGWRSWNRLVWIPQRGGGRRNVTVGGPGGGGSWAVASVTGWSSRE